MLRTTSAFALVLAAAFGPPPAAALDRIAAPLPFADRSAFQTCFTPGQDCTAAIVAAIDEAERSLRVQAYQLTSAPIVAAIAAAQARGVDVRVILDRSQTQGRHPAAAALADAGVPVLVDRRPAIAHSKVLIIDDRIVVTGSFNFSRAAQLRNAENVLIVRDDAALAARYVRNWTERERASAAVGGAVPR
jgi:phosphatidylserine/phosphatidylglycerophosphate/cardiolipin synthase-like enzyme